MDYVSKTNIFGLFLSSGVVRNPDFTMEQLIATAATLRRRYQFRGYIHLKIIPGASEAAIEQVLNLASAVSLNVEAPTRSSFCRLSAHKDYDRDIVAPLKRISSLIASQSRYARLKQTTQFVVGASTEKDSEILRATHGLYARQHLSRVYFSAYQRGFGDPALPGEQNFKLQSSELLTREHRLYQADFLLRQYKWAVEEIPLGADGNLALDKDPKQKWAELHPEYFPVRLRSAEREALLRVPGLGPVLARRILQMRRENGIRSLKDAGLRGKNLEKTAQYVVLD
jgi:predicted DNA-binding helix-hairpin-helix protein